MRVARYATAVAAVGVAALLTRAFPELLSTMRLFFFWCAVLFTAFVAGMGPAMLAIVLSVAGASFVVFPPVGTLALHHPIDLVRLLLFVLFSGSISVTVGLRRRAEERAAALSEQLRADIQARRRHEEHANFINRASEVLGSSLDYEQTMRNLARLAVPALGDWCAIDIARAGAPYERLVVEHNDPKRVQLIVELDEQSRAAPEIDPIVQVLASGKPQLLEELTDEMLAALAQTEEQLTLARTLGLRSWIIAPMIARTKVLGALTVVYSDDSGRRYSEEDLPLIEDLARRAAMAIDNARLFREAEAANRIKDEFLATLSHELRTPLTAISGWANMLQLGLTDETTTRLAVDTIARSAKQQGELIDDLLDLSRVVAGTLHLDIATLDLAGIVEQVIDAARPAAEAKGLSLELQKAAAPVLIRGDDRRVRQIVWNLVTNAVKFTDEWGAIAVTLSVRGGQARVEVRDSGKGIAPEFLPHVWERFRQADSSTARQYGGLGLGLSVVRHLVELHGGTVSASSEGAGRGATFAVELPLARLVHTPEALSLPASRADLPLSGRKILVVDDDHDARTVIGAMLRRFGADVVSAESVDAAMHVLGDTAFDAIVSDLAMPGEDGFSLVRRVRATSAVPMIAVSAIATSADDRRRVMEAGFAEFLRKPVDPEELANTVAQVLAAAAH